MHVLDNPVWAAVTGAHAHLARVHGQAARYHPDVSPIATIRPGADERAWADLVAITEPGTVVGLAGVTASPPPSRWEVVHTIPGVQMVGTSSTAGVEPDVVRLGPGDVPEMADLVGRADMGTFPARAVEMGAYLGVRRDGRLVAMAGERVRPPGWTEISTVCTNPEYRGQGLATRLVRAVAARIAARGEAPYLHSSASNTAAIRLYSTIGFTVRRTTVFRLVRLTGTTAAG